MSPNCSKNCCNIFMHVIHSVQNYFAFPATHAPLKIVGIHTCNTFAMNLLCISFKQIKISYILIDNHFVPELRGK